MSGTEQLSCGGWLRARRAQGELGVGGWGGHQLHHTHSNMRRAFCLPEELVGLILSPLSTQEEDA
jgi:hypothetical protein